MELLEVLRERSQRILQTVQVNCGELGVLTAQALPLRECEALSAGPDGDRALLYAACRQLQLAGEQLRSEGRVFRPDEIMQLVTDREASQGADAVCRLSGMAPVQVEGNDQEDRQSASQDGTEADGMFQQFREEVGQTTATVQPVSEQWGEQSERQGQAPQSERLSDSAEERSGLDWVHPELTQQVARPVMSHLTERDGAQKAVWREEALEKEQDNAHAEAKAQSPVEAQEMTPAKKLEAVSETAWQQEKAVQRSGQEQIRPIQAGTFKVKGHMGLAVPKQKKEVFMANPGSSDPPVRQEQLERHVVGMQGKSESRQDTIRQNQTEIEEGTTRKRGESTLQIQKRQVETERGALTQGQQRTHPLEQVAEVERRDAAPMPYDPIESREMRMFATSPGESQASQRNVWHSELEKAEIRVERGKRDKGKFQSQEQDSQGKAVTAQAAQQMAEALLEGLRRAAGAR